MAQNRHGQRQALHLERLAQTTACKWRAVTAPVLGQPTQPPERRGAFRSEPTYAESRERLLRRGVAPKPIESLY